MAGEHPLSADLTRAGNAADALRTLMLVGGDTADDIFAGLAAKLRSTEWPDVEIRRAALRLAAAVNPRPHDSRPADVINA